MTIGNLIESLIIVKKYAPSHGYCVDADHDIIYFGVEPEKMTDEDNKKLEALGCHGFPFF